MSQLSIYPENILKKRLDVASCLGHLNRDGHSRLGSLSLLTFFTPSSISTRAAEESPRFGNARRAMPRSKLTVSMHFGSGRHTLKWIEAPDLPPKAVPVKTNQSPGLKVTGLSGCCVRWLAANFDGGIRPQLLCGPISL